MNLEQLAEHFKREAEYHERQAQRHRRRATAWGIVSAIGFFASGYFAHGCVDLVKMALP